MAAEYFKYKGLYFTGAHHTPESVSFAENDFELFDDDVIVVTYPKSVQLVLLHHGTGYHPWSWSSCVHLPLQLHPIDCKYWSSFREFSSLSRLDPTHSTNTSEGRVSHCWPSVLFSISRLSSVGEGTMWLVEILSLIQFNGDPTWSKTVPNYMRAPWIGSGSFQEIIKARNPPRLFTSHHQRHIFPKSFLTSSAKVIYTLRNPKDVLVSMYYYSKLMSSYKDPGSFDQFYNNFLQGNVAFGSWFDHVKGWFEIKDQKNVFFITYDELQQDLRGSVIRICQFLGKELDSAAVHSVVENASFESMKQNKMANFTTVPEEVLDHKRGCFLRKGICGDWKNHFTISQNVHFDEVYQERMKDMTVKFMWDKN